MTCTSNIKKYMPKMYRMKMERKCKEEAQRIVITMLIAGPRGPMPGGPPPMQGGPDRRGPPSGGPPMGGPQGGMPPMDHRGK